MTEHYAADSEAFNSSARSRREHASFSDSDEAGVAWKIIRQGLRCGFSQLERQHIVTLHCDETNSIDGELFDHHTPLVVLNHVPVRPFVADLLELELNEDLLRFLLRFLHLRLTMGLTRL